jgi:hypothetical protein
MDQGIVLLGALEDHISSLATVTAAGTAARDELLSAERHASVSAVASLDRD